MSFRREFLSASVVAILLVSTSFFFPTRPDASVSSGAGTPRILTPTTVVRPRESLALPSPDVLLPQTNSTIGVNYQATDNPTAQNEPGIAINPTNPKDLIVSGNDYNTAATGSSGSWASEYTSTDGGLVWSYHPANLNSTFAGGPPCIGGDSNVFFGPTGVAYFAGLGYPGTLGGCVSNPSSTNGGLFVAHSTDGGRTWAFVRVEQDTATNFVDKEWMGVDPVNGVVSIDVMNYSTSGASRTIDYWYSTDMGSTWHGPTVVNPPTDQRMVAAGLAVDIHGGVDVVWQGGSTGNNTEFSRAAAPGQPFSAEMTLGTISCAPAGSSGFPSVNGVQRMNCVPQVWTDTSASSPYRGSLYVVYSTNTTSLQIRSLYSRDNGSTWSSAIAVNNDPSDGADHWWPQVTTGKNGTVYVEFLDRRYNPGNLLIDTTVAVSTDGGASFPSNVRVSSVSGNPNVWPQFMGDYQNTFWSPVGDLSVWTDFRNGAAGNENEDLYVGQLAWMDITSNIPGVAATIDGFSRALPAKDWWVSGTVHNISVPATVTAGGVVNRFLYWEGDVSSTTPYLGNVRMNDSSNLMAVYSACTSTTLFICAFKASPDPITLGNTTTFMVAVTGGNVPYTYTYTSLPPGCLSRNASTLPCTPTNTGNFTVNVTVSDSSGLVVRNATSLVVTRGTPLLTLASVTVSPSTDTLKVGTYANFTATPSCTGGPCSGVTYTWSLNNTTLGNLNITSGSSVKFMAAASGTENLSVAAMLNGKLARNSSIITITTAPVSTLAYVSLTPLAAAVNVSGTLAFTATVGCSGGACSSGSTYAWALNNTALGKLNVSSGPQVLFTANSTAGLVSLTITAHLNGKMATNSSTITIKKSSPPPSTYTVTFSESGLPSGTSWSVTLNGSTKSGTGSIVFTEPNGTYSYAIGTATGYTASPSSGNVSVIGFPIPLSITFTSTSSGSYMATFQESGLPSGTSWSVTMSGSTITSVTSSIAFGETNGSYSFSVGAVAGYTASPPSGTITVNGVAVNKAIIFTALPPGQYSLTFSESGLPTGTNWSVTIGTATHTSTGSTLSFIEVNGTYSYTLLGVVTGYTASPSSGSVTVSGASQTVSITFTPSTATTYAVTFTETGLPAGTFWSVTLSLPVGTSWSMTLNGSTKSSTTATITFQESNGSYGFTVGSVSGYTVSPSTGSVKVSGGPASQTVTFTSSTSQGKTNQTSGFLGLPGDDGYFLIVGIAVAVVAAIAALVLLKGGKKKGTPGYGLQDSKNIADGAAKSKAVE